MSFFSKITALFAASSNQEALAPSNTLVAQANSTDSLVRGTEFVGADEEFPSFESKDFSVASAPVDEHDEADELDRFELFDSAHCSHGRGRDRKRNLGSKKRTQFLRNCRRMKAAAYYGGATV